MDKCELLLIGVLGFALATPAWSAQTGNETYSIKPKPSIVSPQTQPPIKPTLPVPRQTVPVARVTEFKSPSCLEPGSRLTVHGSGLLQGKLACRLTGPGVTMKPVQPSDQAYQFQISGALQAGYSYAFVCVLNGQNVVRKQIKGCELPAKQLAPKPIVGKEPDTARKILKAPIVPGPAAKFPAPAPIAPKSPAALLDLVGSIKLAAPVRMNAGELQNVQVAIRNQATQVTGAQPHRGARVAVMMADRDLSRGLNLQSDPAQKLGLAPGVLVRKDTDFPTIPAAGSGVAAMVTVQIPKDLKSGEYYWCALIDSGNDIQESNEKNNITCLSKPMHVAGATLGTTTATSPSPIFDSAVRKEQLNVADTGSPGKDKNIPAPIDLENARLMFGETGLLSVNGALGSSMTGPIEVETGSRMSVTWNGIPEMIDGQRVVGLRLRMRRHEFNNGDCTDRKQWGRDLSFREGRQEYREDQLPTGGAGALNLAQPVFAPDRFYYFKACIGVQDEDTIRYVSGTNVVKVAYGDVVEATSVVVAPADSLLPDLVIRDVDIIRTGPRRNRLRIWFGADPPGRGTAPPPGTFNYAVAIISPANLRNISSVPESREHPTPIPPVPGHAEIRETELGGAGPMSPEDRTDPTSFVYDGTASVKNLGLFGYGDVIETGSSLPSEQAWAVVVHILNGNCGRPGRVGEEPGYRERNYCNNQESKILGLRPDELETDLVLHGSAVNSGPGWALIDVRYALQSQDTATLNLALPPDTRLVGTLGTEAAPEHAMDDASEIRCTTQSGSTDARVTRGVNRHARFLCTRPVSSRTTGEQGRATLVGRSSSGAIRELHELQFDTGINWASGEGREPPLPDLVASVSATGSGPGGYGGFAGLVIRNDSAERARVTDARFQIVSSHGGTPLLEERFAVPELEPRQAHTIRFPIPLSIHTEGASAMLIADAGSDIFEVNERNNIASALITERFGSVRIAPSRVATSHDRQVTAEGVCVGLAEGSGPTFSEELNALRALPAGQVLVAKRAILLSEFGLGCDNSIVFDARGSVTFDLGHLSDLHTPINHAELHFRRIRDLPGTCSRHAPEVSRMTASSRDTGSTWATATEWGSSSMGTRRFVADITEHVQAWVDGAVSNAVATIKTANPITRGSDRSCAAIYGDFELTVEVGDAGL